MWWADVDQGLEYHRQSSVGLAIKHSSNIRLFYYY